VIKIQHMERADKQFFAATIVAPLIVWWFFTGRNRYGTKGMK
jgi:hypothetical protein